MTGTPQPIEWMFRKKSVHRLLLFAKCKHVDPENVYLVPSDFAIRNLKNNWNRNQRAIYFTIFSKSTLWIYTIQLQYTIGLWDSNKRDRLGRSLFHSVFQSAGTFPLQQGVCNSFVTGCATVFYSVHEDLYTTLRHLSDRLHHRG